MVLYAKDIVETDFLTMSAAVTALEAAKAMRERKHGFVIVADASGTPVGIATEWDFVSKILADARSPDRVNLGDIMTRDLVSVKADDGIDHVALIMAQRGVRRVLVVKDGKVVGVVTAMTILRRLKEYVDRISTSVARFQGPWV